MENENKTEWIDNYLDGTLTEIEQKIFEERLSRDTELGLEVRSQKLVRDLIIEQVEKESLLKMFDGFHAELLADQDLGRDEGADFLREKQEVEDNKKRDVIRKIIWGNWSYLAAAASVAILIIGFWTVLKNTDRDLSGEKLEMRLEADDENLNVPFLIWKEIDGKQVIEDDKRIDVVIKRKSAYSFHYKFGRILEVYSDTLTGNHQKISVQFDKDLGVYQLWLGKKSYKIDQTNQVLPLR